MESVEYIQGSYIKGTCGRNGCDIQMIESRQATCSHMPAAKKVPAKNPETTLKLIQSKKGEREEKLKRNE